MDHNQHIETCKRFYAEGGYTKAPSNPSRLKKVQQALYASQYYADGGKVGHLAEMDAALNLTPQEKSLYERHIMNLQTPNIVHNSDGSDSTLYQMVRGDGAEKYYNVPTVYGGKILSPDDAWERAKQQGLDTFPSYASPDYADDRYAKMHQYMEKDRIGQPSGQYAEGGPVYTPPENMGHVSPLKLAYAAQYFATGGAVKRAKGR